jgi:hypothetical protein
MFRGSTAFHLLPFVATEDGSTAIKKQYQHGLLGQARMARTDRREPASENAEASIQRRWHRWCGPPPGQFLKF